MAIDDFSLEHKNVRCYIRQERACIVEDRHKSIGTLLNPTQTISASDVP